MDFDARFAKFRPISDRWIILASLAKQPPMLALELCLLRDG